MKKFFLFPIVLVLLVSTACGLPASVTRNNQIKDPMIMAHNSQQKYPPPIK